MMVPLGMIREDIRNAKPGSNQHCPVALAIKRLCQPGIVIQVDEETIDFSVPETYMRLDYITTPNDIRKFIVAFDYGIDMSPLATQVNIPEQFLRKVPVAV